MEVEPLVSTIIPTFNRASLVCGAIDSVRQQTYRNVEIIVVDDGSTDETQATLKRYGDSVRVIVQDNAGPAAARNRGIEAARGDIVAFLDSDDTWKQTKLERQVTLLNKVDDSVPCCLCNAAMVFPDGHQILTFDYSQLAAPLDEGIWQNVAEVLATRFVLFTQTIAIRRRVLEKVGGFDESLRFLEDYELPLRLALEGPWAYIREPMVMWRQESPGSYAAIALSNELRLRECAVQMRQSLWKSVKDSDSHRHLRSSFLRELWASKCLLRATQLRRRGNWADSMVGDLIFQTERICGGIHRRSPWYPRMQVDPVGSSSGGNAQGPL